MAKITTQLTYDWLYKDGHRFRRIPRGDHKAVGARKIITVKDLSRDQDAVYAALKGWLLSRDSIIRLGGYAGTGKSTLISVLANTHPHLRIAFCTFTGKAANGLRQKLELTGVDMGEKNYCGTIHGLIYIPYIVDGEIIEWQKKPELDYDLLVIDEASMVDEDTFNDLQSYGVPILAVGDHGQLAPVGNGFNLMEDPDLRLEKIHRQAEHSRILQLSAYVRSEGGLPNRLESNDEVSFIPPERLDDLLSVVYREAKTEDLAEIGVLCFKNATRVKINQKIRHLRFNDHVGTDPHAGDQLICLKNSYNFLFNGMRALVTQSRKDTPTHFRTAMEFPDDYIEADGNVLKNQFHRERTISRYEDVQFLGFNQKHWWSALGLLFDFGYALTVHKAQGSAFKHAIVIYERGGGSGDEFARWIYTAATRASERLTVVVR